MTRRTSIETYKAVLDSGMVSKRRLEVYNTLYENGEMTSGETFSVLNKNNERSPLSQTRARFTELRDMGLIMEVNERPCRVTGRSAIVWATTDSLPVKLKKKESKTEKIQHALNNLSAIGHDVKCELITKEALLIRLRDLYNEINQIK